MPLIARIVIGIGSAVISLVAANLINKKLDPKVDEWWDERKRRKEEKEAAASNPSSN